MTIDMTWQEFATVCITTTVLFAAAAVGSAFAWRRERRRRIHAETLLASVDAKSVVVDQLKSAIDNLGLEVERIGEVERFAVRQLMERLSVGEPVRINRVTPVPRVVTPH